jgi:hypothetical protein
MLDSKKNFVNFFEWMPMRVKNESYKDVAPV